MASQITHIVFADKVHRSKLNHLDQKKFYIGTVFPDIRYLGVIDRKATHFGDITWKEVLEEPDSFTAGMKFHSLLDHIREKYMIDHKVYDIIPKSPYTTQTFKLYEDEVYYNYLTDWGVAAGYLEDAVPEELLLINDQYAIKKWHKIWSKYFLEVPSNHSRKDLITSLGFDPQVVELISRDVEIISQSQIVNETIEKFYNDFETLI